MSEERVTIEVDGQLLEARKGAMLIDVTDAAGIYIPRFCYHKKLSVAANCRMCLVEVERAPKPQPACATPVMDGMKVFTRSEKAIAGQRATMEFLLINHPLDCPVCDQGGECELQDLSLGYGSDLSQYTERKRVVRDKNIGPLIQTDMTRCIHCTRCVRFGEEVAGLRELGATGRGEHMEIGTYVAHAVSSELSGNVIDLCPVGALTSKPYRFSARAWELQQRDTIAPHDCVGSNLHVHVKGQVVKRVVPKENEAINETWLADRDRFSYQALNSPERLLKPRIKRDGAWHDCEWDVAIDAIVARLAPIAARGDANRIGGLAAPSATTEEFFLLQRLLRGLGSQNVDHRLRQQDFSTQAEEPPYPSLAMTLGDLEQADCIVIAGGYPRHEQPLVNHRVRKAALRGACVFVVDVIDNDYNFDLSGRVIVRPSALPATIAGIAKAIADGVATAANAPAGQRLAAALRTAERPVVLVGSALAQLPVRGAVLSALTALASAAKARLGLLTEGANAAGAWLAGAVPHRGPGGRAVTAPGLDAGAMLAQPLVAYLLLGLEPDLDSADPASAARALAGAELVVALTAFGSPALEQAAHVLLPTAVFAENEGTYVNLSGTWQGFAAAVKPPGEARPAWKILRLLGERLGLSGFDAVTCADVSTEIKALCGTIAPLAAAVRNGASEVAEPNGIEAILRVPMYATDPLVRRAAALQQMPQRGDERARLSPATLAGLSLRDGDRVVIRIDDGEASGTVAGDPCVPDGCCLIEGGTPFAARLGRRGPPRISRAD